MDLFNFVFGLKSTIVSENWKETLDGDNSLSDLLDAVTG